MIVWLWDADGPDGSASGVTDGQATACRAAEEGMAVTRRSEEHTSELQSPC